MRLNTAYIPNNTFPPSPEALVFTKMSTEMSVHVSVCVIDPVDVQQCSSRQVLIFCLYSRGKTRSRNWSVFIYLAADSRRLHRCSGCTNKLINSWSVWSKHLSLTSFSTLYLPELTMKDTLSSRDKETTGKGGLPRQQHHYSQLILVLTTQCALRRRRSKLTWGMAAHSASLQLFPSFL